MGICTEIATLRGDRRPVGGGYGTKSFATAAVIGPVWT